MADPNSKATVRGIAAVSWLIASAVVAIPWALATARGTSDAGVDSAQAATGAKDKIRFEPHYSAGQVVRYQIESTTVTTSHRDGIVSDPEGASALTVVWNATVRMEVESANADGSMRMKTTYEKSVASHQTDAYDPAAEGIEQQYHDLEGQSFEFLLDANGRMTSAAGFEESQQGQGAGAEALRAWIGQMAATSGAPHEGIAVGQTWQSEQPVPSSPLDGLVWHSHSTYLRNESCAAVKNTAEAPQPFANEQCAVIMTKVVLSGAKGVGHDATPPGYKKNNLKTSGDWTGDGESLSYIALSSGRLVSVVQSSDEKMDLLVSSLLEGGSMHYQGSVKTKTQLSMLPEVAAK